MTLRSVLSHAKGLSLAKEGLRHWLLQRLTALALIPLTFWFVISLIGLVGTGYNEFIYWLDKPANAAFMILFLAIAFHHAQLGMQVIFEDYISNQFWKTSCVVIVRLGCYLLMALSIFSILKIAIGG